MTNYVLAPGYLGVQFWNDDKSDLLEVRRDPSLEHTEVDGIPDAEAKRLVDLGAIVEASKADQVEVSPGALEEPAGNGGRDEWAAYADSLGLTVPPGSGREDIKRLVSDSRG